MKMVTIDCESTGVDVSTDRILTFFMRAKDGDKVVFEQNWVIDPGVEIPKEASDVHSMTTEWVREHGDPKVSAAIFDITRALLKYGGQGYVVVGYNSAFDLAILDSEDKRMSGPYPQFEPHARGSKFRYLDPAIFSRKFDKFKKGGHQLITVAKRNGIEIEEDRLHAADYDVEVTEKLVPIMLNRAWQELKDLRQGLTPDEFVTKLQEWQAEQKKEWADGLTKYFAEQGKTEEDGSPIVVSGRFPW